MGVRLRLRWGVGEQQPWEVGVNLLREFSSKENKRGSTWERRGKGELFGERESERKGDFWNGIEREGKIQWCRGKSADQREDFGNRGIEERERELWIVRWCDSTLKTLRKQIKRTATWQADFFLSLFLVKQTKRMLCLSFNFVVIVILIFNQKDKKV